MDEEDFWCELIHWRVHSSGAFLLKKEIKIIFLFYSIGWIKEAHDNASYKLISRP